MTTSRTHRKSPTCSPFRFALGIGLGAGLGSAAYQAVTAGFSAIDPWRAIFVAGFAFLTSFLLFRLIHRLQA